MPDGEIRAWGSINATASRYSSVSWTSNTFTFVRCICTLSIARTQQTTAIAMAESPCYSSPQSSQYEKLSILMEQEMEQENLDSSPLRARGNDVAKYSSEKPKKPPTVTPKRFTKFFTPRPSITTRGRTQSKAGRQLRDITKNGSNRRRTVKPLKAFGKNIHRRQDPADDCGPGNPACQLKRTSIIAKSPTHFEALANAFGLPLKV